MKQFSIEALIKIESIPEIEAGFIQFLSVEDRELLASYRQGHDCQNEVIFKIGLQLESYLVSLFQIEKPYQQLQASIARLDPLQYFYQTIALPSIRRLRIDSEPECSERIREIAAQYDQDEMVCIDKILSVCDGLEMASWCQWVWQEKAMPYIQWQVFSLPQKLSYSPFLAVDVTNIRMDYDWVGPTLNQKQIMHHVNYCIDCHEKENDSCSKGFWSRKDNGYKVNPLGRVLWGCPLNQKISQMHGMRKKHYLIAALAVIMMDNPLCLVTGDRICNDCMLSCIYQKVDPVDTPSVESDTVRQILNLPYGAEIYLLLAKWNPLKASHYQYNPSMLGNVAVIGMGPSGFAMSYYLLMAGCQVVGFDGLPIRESLDRVHKPIEHFYPWADELQPQVSGFGGVIDYGITVRWDKRLILLVWVLLRRFPRFSLLGSIRMGGAITIQSLSQLGFDHVVMATGAGLPKAHPIQNKQGIYFANEFLMQLHLSGMMHHEERRGFKLPIAIIGSGLTAIDAATEAQVHYFRWVMQVAFWVDSVGLDALKQGFSEEEETIIDTWYRHGQFIRAHQKDTKRLYEYIQKEGGVHILYRRSMVESPAYRTHALELKKALEQGIQYHEYMDPISVESKGGWVESILCQHKAEKVTFLAKTILIATGSKPNVAYYYEHRDVLEIEDGYYKRVDGFFAAIQKNPGYVSIIGDLHPKYHGSVVGALASAKDSYANILERLSVQKPLAMDKVKAACEINILKVDQISTDIIALELDTQVVLPLGSYIKVALIDEGVLIQVKGVVVQLNIAWVDASQAGAELLGRGEFCGILGPSGTRILSQECSERIHVITDSENVIWAAAVVSSAKQQGKNAIVYTKGDIHIPFSKASVKDIEHLKSVEDEDIIYCLNASNLKAVQSLQHRFRECYAICDGPMMCMLKGICGQCIQWQLDKEGRPLKAVFSCSWQVQPVVLIDIEHFSIRKQVATVENTLYKKWKALIQ